MSVGAGPFLAALRQHGVSLASGVPCSLLSPLFDATAADPAWSYVPAASEGEALAVAAGAWLGGRLGLVLLQNSGLGNAVNPLTSLCATYGIPAVLVIGHRGQSADDAPQHRLMGQVTAPLLELLGVPWRALGSEDGSALADAAWAAHTATERCGPAALLVARGTFGASDSSLSSATARSGNAALEGASQHGVDSVVEGAAPRSASAAVEGTRCVRPPTRWEALSALSAALRDDDLVIATTGRTGRELLAIEDRPGSFPMAGSMGCASALGLGLALAVPGRRVIVLDGDGALLMKLGSCATIGARGPGSLLHLLLDNGCYASTGGQPSASPGVCLPSVAAACGYRRALHLSSSEQLTQLVSAFDLDQGPVFATLAVAPGNRAQVGRPARDPHTLRDHFRKAAQQRGSLV